MSSTVEMNDVVTITGVDKVHAFEPFTVTWRELSFRMIPSTLTNLIAKGRRMFEAGAGEAPRSRTILSSISGQFASGELTALMGPSGAGKSTLLECLIGIRSSGRSGRVTFSGKDKISMAFIPQQDHFLNLLTVREALTFASKLQNCSERWRQDSDHRVRVDQLIKRLGLETCVDTRIARCSGGQLKRLSIGQELVAEPNILILDEPTSGLDSSSCYSTVEFLHRLTQEEGIAIVATIHQPSAKVFNLFHKVYALSIIGKCIYEGPPQQVVDHFKSFDLQVPQFYNPADFLIEVASGDYGLEGIRAMALHQTGQANDRAIQAQASNILLKSRLRPDPELEEMVLTPQFPFFRHLSLLTSRATICMLRDPLLFAVRLVSCVLVAVFIGLLYNGANVGTSDGCPLDVADAQDLENLSNIREKMEDEVTAISNNLGNWFFAIIFVQFGGLLPTVLSVPLEMSAFAKERTNGWYGVNSYFLANCIAHIPLQIVCPVVYIGIMYWWTEQIFEWDRLAIIMAIFVSLSLTAQSHGVLVGAIFMRSVVTAVFVAPMTCIPLLLFSGFFLKIENIALYLKPLTLISYNRYAFESAIVTLYGYDRCGPDTVEVIAMTKQRLEMFMSNVFRVALDEGDYEDIDLDTNSTHYDSGPSIKNLTTSLVKGIAAQLGGSTEVVDGQTVSGVLAVFRLTEKVVFPNIMALLFFFLVFRLITYVIIYFMGTNKKG